MIAQPLVRSLVQPLVRPVVARRNAGFTPAVTDYFARLGALRLGGAYDRAIADFIDAVGLELGWPENGAYQLLGGYAYPGNTTGAIPGILETHNTGTLVTFPGGAWDPRKGPLSDGATMFTRLGRNNNADPQNDQAMGAVVSQTTPGALGAIIGVGVAEVGTSQIVQSAATLGFSRSRSVESSVGAGLVLPSGDITGLACISRAAASSYRLYLNQIIYSVPTVSDGVRAEEVKGYRRGDVAPAYFTGRLLFQFTGPAIGFLDSDARLHAFRAICAKLASDLAAA